jgi:aminoglycoside phosphotransferase (APT) family kinase protein
MLLPSQQVLAGLDAEFGRLNLQLPSGEASASYAIATALQLLARREQGDVTAVRAQLQHLARRFDDAVAPVAGSPSLHNEIKQIQAAFQSTENAAGLQESEALWRNTLGLIESFASHLFAATDIDATTRTRIGLALNEWEIADLQGQLGQDDSAAKESSIDITAASLTAYLQDRFGDPALEITAFKPLPGGFGKQTFLFTVNGKEFSGDFVMRRDPPVPLFDNDCHRGNVEYQLIRAVYEAGFPAPEALWVDTEHKLLPGGDFIIMRRSPGVPGGSVFEAKGGIPASLAQTLAEILARLHALPPMAALSELTDSINAERWNLPLETCVRKYITDYQALYQNDAHLPSPALASLFGWLLSNVPDLPGKPVLLHGDIGFHNFLFDDGKLSAVLDWEFAHLGDPAEDLAYVRNTVGPALDWDDFMASYRAAGGIEVSAARLHFFQIWGQMRNICTANMAAAKFATGRVNDLKMVLLPHLYIPQFLSAAKGLIEQGYVGT